MTAEVNDLHCPVCEEPMKQAVSDDHELGAGPHGTTAIDLPVGWTCQNPDCPGKESELAPLAGGQQWLNQPGTEGGANGGA